ncbi:MAG: hypothetical protein LBJ84_01535 [Oscillospiraceae bacterium]|nr:hypothetical protein [Oscillospiraceae bacterium]
MANDRSFKDSGEGLEEFTLESILAEYKGEAYIGGEKKTPSTILDEKADEIIMELSGKRDPPLEISDFGEDMAFGEEEEEDGGGGPEAWSGYQYAAADPLPEIAREVADAIKSEAKLRKPARGIKLPLFSRAREDIPPEEAPDGPEDGAYIAEEPGEPDLRAAARRFAADDTDVMLRWAAAFAVACAMAALTLLFEAGAHLPFGLERNRALLTGILMIMQILVMMIGVEVLIKGVYSIMRPAPGIEFLVLMSNFSALCSGAVAILSDESALGLPYCAVSAFSMAFTLLGEKLYRRSYLRLIKQAASEQEPFVGLTEYRGDLRRVVFRRARSSTDGFYNALMARDICEGAYRYCAPLLVAFSFVVTILGAVAHGQSVHIMQALSAPLAAAAAFSGHLAFSVPFSIVSKRVLRAGAAMAGWMCADDLTDIDGLCVTDLDLFPEGTLSVSGVKIFEGETPEKAIRYTSSLIKASGSGLAGVFSEVLRREGMTAIRVDDFGCYEGGISGLIHGERVMTGSAAYMKLMSVRIPDDINLSTAVFTAVDERLIAMFAMDYIPVNTVRSALLNILRWKVRLLFAVQDFNITTKMAEQKFKAPFEDVENLPIRSTYDIVEGVGGGRVAAIFSRDGLEAVGELVSGAHILKTTAFFATALSVISAVAGVLLTVFLCWLGAYRAVSAGNLLLFMLSTFVASLLVCGLAKFRR